MNCISITRVDEDLVKKCIGFSYVVCQLDNQTVQLSDVHVESVEKRIANYCLLLPYIYENDFGGRFAVVYDDWDIGNESFQKTSPSICRLCFETDVTA